MNTCLYCTDTGRTLSAVRCPGTARSTDAPSQLVEDEPEDEDEYDVEGSFVNGNDRNEDDFRPLKGDAITMPCDRKGAAVNTNTNVVPHSAATLLNGNVIKNNNFNENTH